MACFQNFMYSRHVAPILSPKKSYWQQGHEYEKINLVENCHFLWSFANNIDISPWYQILSWRCIYGTKYTFLMENNICYLAFIWNWLMVFGLKTTMVLKPSIWCLTNFWTYWAQLGQPLMPKNGSMGYMLKHIYISFMSLNFRSNGPTG